MVDWAVLLPHRLGQLNNSGPSPPGRGEIFPPFIWPPDLSRRGEICPEAALDYVVPPEQMMWCAYLAGFQYLLVLAVSSGMMQAGGRLVPCSRI
jgi:hypothetical protein